MDSRGLPHDARDGAPDDEPDELSGVFDALTPEDFGVHASTEVFHVPATAGSLRGRTAFDGFVSTQLRIVRTTYLAAPGRLRPVAVLATPDAERVFAPTEGEAGDQYLARLRRSARAVGATWLFIAHHTSVGIALAPTEDVHGGPPSHDTADGAFYFAQRREDGEVDTRFGALRASIDATTGGQPRDLGRHVVGHPSQRVAMFTDLLAG